MQRSQVAQISLDVTKWLDTYRSDINILTRHQLVRLIEEVAEKSNWVKVCEETDLGEVGDEYFEQLDLIGKDVENTIWDVEPMLAEIICSVVAVTGWRHHV